MAEKLSPISAKGDLIAGDTSGNAAKISGPTTDGQVLMANSAAATGLVWSTPSGGTASVTSAEYLSALNRLSGVSSQMTSADNVLSNAISALMSADSATSVELAGWPLDGPNLMKRQGNVIGDIFVASAFTSAGDFTNDLAGRALSVTSSTLLITGSAVSTPAYSNVTPLLYLPEWTNLDVLTIECTFSFPNSNSSANSEYGMNMGIFGGTDGYSIVGVMYGAFDSNLGGTRIQYGDKFTSNVLVDNIGVGNNVPNIGVDDVIHYKLQLYENKVIWSVRNVTDDSAWVTIQGTLTGTQTKHGTGHIGLAPGVTNVRIHSFKVNSKQIKNPDIYLYGDSKFTKGTTQAESLPALLKNNYGVVVGNSGVGDHTALLVNALPEVKNRVQPKKVLVAVSNDLRYGIATSVWQNNLSIINADLTSAGIDVYFTAFEEGAGGTSQSAMDAHLLSAYPTKYVRRAYLDTASCKGCLLSDGIHLATFGNQTVYDAIVLDGKLAKAVTSTPTSYTSVETVTGDSYTLSAGDHNKVKYFTNSTSAIFVNIPTGLSVGFETLLFRGSGARSVTISAQTSVTFEAQGTVLQDEKTAATIIHQLSDKYLGVGAFLAVSGGTGTASVTSAEHASVVDRVSALSSQVTSADNAISNAVSIVSAAQAVTSADLTSVKNRLSGLSSQVTSADNAISNAVSIVSAAQGVTSAEVTSVRNRVSAISDSLTSIASIASAAASAAAVASANITSLASNVSAISVRLDSLSQVVSVISQQVSIISAGLGGLQLAKIGGAQSVSAAALTKISGLSLSIAANGAYEINGKLLFIGSAFSVAGFGISTSGTTFNAVGIRWFLNQSAAANWPASGISTMAQMGYMNEAGFGSVTLSILSGPNTTQMVDVQGLILASGTGGSIQFKAKAGGSGVITLKTGSFIRAYKVG